MRLGPKSFVQSRFWACALPATCSHQLYMSPERFGLSKYAPSADIWSVGIVAYECAFGYPFPQFLKGFIPPFEFAAALEKPIPVPEKVLRPLPPASRHLAQPIAPASVRCTAAQTLSCPFPKERDPMALALAARSRAFSIFQPPTSPQLGSK